MSDIKLFPTNNGTVEELKGTSVQLEKSLQTLIEQNLETFLGIRFLASVELPRLSGSCVELVKRHEVVY